MKNLKIYKLSLLIGYNLRPIIKLWEIKLISILEVDLDPPPPEGAKLYFYELCWLTLWICQMLMIYVDYPDTIYVNHGTMENIVT